jgi:N-acetylneuraminic acid mutarotase
MGKGAMLAALACCSYLTTTAAAAAGSWHTAAPMAVKRESLGVGALNGTLYAMGGFDFPNYPTSVEAYNSATNTWALVANMLVPRFNLGVGVLGGLLYAVGGARGRSTGTALPLASVETYHPANDSWALVAPMTEKRDCPGVGVLGGLLYAVGGENDDGFEGHQFLQTVEAYNPATNTWAGHNLIAPMHEPRSSMGVGVLGGLLYAVGGDSGDVYLASVEAYHPGTNTWTLVAPMSVNRVNLGVGVLGGLLYAAGGYDMDRNFLASVEAYNPATNSWALVAPMSVGREGLGVGVLGGMLYAVGGFNIDVGDGYLASVEVYPGNGSLWR